MSEGIQISIGGDMAPFISAINEVRSEVNRMGNTARGGFERMSSAARSSASQIQSSFAALRSLGSGGVGGLLGGMGGLAGMGGMAAGAAAPFAAFGVALKGSLTALSSFGELDSLTRGMATLEVSAGATEKRLALLRDVAKMPGLGLEEAVRGDIRLRSAGISAALSEKSLRAFGNALATVGAGKEELHGVLLALSQIATKSKVSAEEVNQLAERLPQTRKAMIAAFGTADTEVLTKKGITPTLFIEAMVEQFGKLQKVSGGAKNSVENFGDSWKQLKWSAAEFFTPAAAAVVSLTEGLMGGAREALKFSKSLLGFETPADDTRWDKEKAAAKAVEDAAAADRQRANDAIRQGNEVANANAVFWENLKRQQLANDQLVAEKKKALDEATVKAAEESLAASREKAFAATLSEQANLMRKMDVLRSGPLGQAAVDAASSPAAKATIAANSAEYLTLKKQLEDLQAKDADKAAREAEKLVRNPDNAALHSLYATITTSLGRIGGGGQAMTFLPMVSEQRKSNGYLKTIADKLRPAVAIV